MREENIITAIISAVTETIENMAFSEVLYVGVEKKMPPPEEGSLGAVLPVFSPVIGTLSAVLPGGLLECLVECIYGPEDRQDTGNAAADTMGELLNTIAGKMMSYITDPDQEFEMGLPVIQESFPGEEPAEAVAYLFDVEGHRLFIGFSGIIPER